MKERFDAYKVALDANFMQIDEVRYAEDLEPLGLNWIKLGLQDVLYDPDTKTVYTPNTNATNKIGDNPLIPEGEEDIIELEERGRGNPYRDGKTGRFASGHGSKSTEPKNSRDSTSLKSLIGKKTSDGRVVKSINPHAQQRANEKEIYASNALKSITKSKPRKGNKPDRLVYHHDKTKVIYDTKQDQIVTVIYKP